MEVAEACVKSDKGDWENGRKEAAKIYEENETACQFPELLAMVKGQEESELNDQTMRKRTWHDHMTSSQK